MTLWFLLIFEHNVSSFKGIFTCRLCLLYVAANKVVSNKSIVVKKDQEP